VSALGTRLTKAIRVRSDAVRRVYTAARRAGRYWRDGERRAALRKLAQAPLSIGRDQGLAVVEPARFPEIAGVVTEARAGLDSFLATRQPAGQTQKRFLLPVVDPRSLTFDSAAVRLALRHDILAAVSHYLGVVPFLSAISVLYSDVTDAAPMSSQLHHCDGDDVTQVKIFVYCSDVDDQSGPLTVLPADDSQRVRRALGYLYRQRLTDAQVASVVGTGRERPILGPAGTTVLVDTSRCFHYGSRVGPGAIPRLVTMIQYQTPYSFMLPAGAQTSLPFRRLIRSGMPALERLVLGE